MSDALQDLYSPDGICFGCGPVNAQGLQIKSHPDGDALVCTWTPAPHHQAFEGVLNGGIIGSLLDCHMNWTALWSLMRRDGLAKPPLTVTAQYAIKLARPTPVDGPLILRAHATELVEGRAVIEGTLEARGKVCATASGTFIQVPASHPAHKHWTP